MAVKARPSAANRTTTRAQSATRSPGSRTKLHNVELVPGPEHHKMYIGRNITQDKTEFDVFDYALDTKRNVLIEGPTGPGKTTAVRAYAAKKKMPFYAIPSNVGIDPSQLFGKFIMQEDGSVVWIDGKVTSLVRHGGVLLINEVNFLPERVATVLFGLLDGRRQITLLDHKGEVIDAHEDLLIIADMNPDYEGTRPLNKAFRNRFAIQLHWDYDPAVEKKLVKSKSLLEMAARLRKDHIDGTYETPCSTNMLVEFEDIYTAMGYEFAVVNFVNHFASDERQPVKVVLDTYEANIKADLTPKAPGGDKSKDEESKLNDEDALKEQMDPERNQWIEERVDEYGKPIMVLVDHEWGVFDVDWNWDGEDQ